MKLLITTGGGGHFAPALAVIRALPKDWKALVVGRKYALEGDAALSLEYQTAKRLGIAFTTLITDRVQRKLSRHTVPSLLRMPVGLYQARQIVKQYKPDVVLSFGGYVTVPVVLAASLANIPVIVHEQTLSAGLANEIATFVAQKICISWEKSFDFFPKEKTILTGNPLRKEFFTKASDESSKKAIQTLFPRTDNKLPLLYITGGSAGAHAINVLLEGCLDRLLAHYRIIHQAGDAKEFSDFDRLNKKRGKLPKALQARYHITKFVDPLHVSNYMKQASLVISRSGMNTVTELLFVGIPSLLIPLPYGQRNEQLENALFVVEAGMGEIAKQAELTPDSIYTRINEMIHNRERYEKNAQSAKKLIVKDAAEKIIALTAHVQEEKKTKKNTTA